VKKFLEKITYRACWSVRGLKPRKTLTKYTGGDNINKEGEKP
jgi:hypothetical protein